MADEANGTTHSPIVLSRDALAVQMISVRTGTMIVLTVEQSASKLERQSAVLRQLICCP